MRSKLTVAVCAVLAALSLAGPLAAQLPRQRRLDTFSQIRYHLRTGGFARTVTVSPVGGDYAELDTACSFVATQTRSATATWLVLVYPGNYTTDCVGAPVATPTFTSIFRYDDLSPARLDSADTPADEECGTWEVTSGVPQIEWQPCDGIVTGSPYNRVVIVDSGGGGDYLTVEEAVAFVATQTRSDTARWVIRIQPGPDHSIAAAPLAVPSYTTIVGDIPHAIYEFWGQTRLICPALASGTCITLAAGSALSGLNVRFSGTLTAAAKIVEIIGGGAALIDVGLENNSSTATFPLSFVETATGSSVCGVLYYVRMYSVASAVNVTYFKHQNAGTCHIIDSLIASNGNGLNGIHNTSTGTVSVVRTAIGKYYGSNSDAFGAVFRNDTTGKIEPSDSVWLGPTVGVVDDWHTPVRVRTFVDTPFATCSPTPSEIALDIGTTKRICVCVAANDWDCATLTP